MTKLYYYPYTVGSERFEESPMYDLMYDLESYSPPHKKVMGLDLNKCPAAHSYENQSFIIRSPLDIELSYNPNYNQWDSTSPDGIKSLILLPESVPQKDYSAIIQFGFYYLFWQEKKSDTQLFVYDAPLYSVDTLPNFYLTSGMIPIGRYTRNTSMGIVVKDATKPIKIQRGQAICTVTAVDSQKVKLEKKKPPQHVLDENNRHNFMKHFCPYTVSRQLFSKWL